jgi:peptidoglycan/xylan/chitin deacetylase (PgdA/CDA1 family)
MRLTDPSHADVTLLVSWQRIDDSSLFNTTVKQTWFHGEDHWVITKESSVAGDPGLLHDLLAVAGRLGVPVTVFAVGSWLDDHPEVAGAILSGGHELANHTYTHPALGQASAAAVADEIVRCRDALTRHAGSPGTWFRPSGLAVPSTLILAEAGRAGYRTVVGYDVDPLDYQDPPAATIVERVNAGLHSGAVVSLHTGHANTVTAFEPMVAAARRRQLVPVRLRDLLPPPA